MRDILIQVVPPGSEFVPNRWEPWRSSEEGDGEECARLALHRFLRESGHAASGEPLEIDVYRHDPDFHARHPSGKPFEVVHINYAINGA